MWSNITLYFCSIFLDDVYYNSISRDLSTAENFLVHRRTMVSSIGPSLHSSGSSRTPLITSRSEQDTGALKKFYDLFSLRGYRDKVFVDDCESSKRKGERAHDVIPRAMEVMERMKYVTAIAAIGGMLSGYNTGACNVSSSIDLPLPPARCLDLYLTRSLKSL